MLERNDAIAHYSRKDVQKAMAEAAYGREIAVQYGDKGFGKRPDILQYENDVLELAKQGATSFHMSEERWSDPLLLRPSLSTKQLDEIMVSFDCVIDIDTKFLGFAKIATALVIDLLRFYGIQNFGVKFSGNRGFHICVPFESFPEKVNEQKTKDLFPETPRAIAMHLKERMKEQLSSEILSTTNVEEIMKATGLPEKDLFKNGKFDPYAVVGIDTVLISSRHMFRMPYSINEKSGLVSIPIEADEVRDFQISRAKIGKVKVDAPFLKTPNEAEATMLLVDALDAVKKTPSAAKDASKQEYKELDFKMPEAHFPPCIKDYCLKGLDSDGRKRAVFIMINFFTSLNYPHEEVEKILLEWNEKNYEKLKEGYILSQLSWHKKQSQKILPPNCENEMYYKSIGICHPDTLCAKIKNPVQYAKKRYFLAHQNDRKKRVKKDS